MKVQRIANISSFQRESPIHASLSRLKRRAITPLPYGPARPEVRPAGFQYGMPYAALRVTMTESRTGRPLRSLGRRVGSIAVHRQSLSGNWESGRGLVLVLYDRPDNAFAWQSVHHLVMLAVALAIIAVLAACSRSILGRAQEGGRQIRDIHVPLCGFRHCDHIIMRWEAVAYDFP